MCALLAATACSPVNAPDPRTLNIPAPQVADQRRKALNEGNDSIMIVPLAEDVLVPKYSADEPLPADTIGPLEFRGETVANALELILDDYNIPIAFETNEGLKRRVTVSKLSGSVDKVTRSVCGLANLYCAYDDGVLVVRDTQTFTVALPPIGEDEDFEGMASGLEAITKLEVDIDTATRTLIYTATQRTAKLANAYFERLRSATALIIYETYIWEVQLSNVNTTGIRWQQLETLGAFNIGLNVDGAISNGITGTPISIGLPTRGDVDLAAGDIFRFLSEQGAVKTISQPQLTVLSGSEAKLKVAETRNYISELSRSTDADGDETVSTTTDQVDSGFTLEIDSSWDQSTVYGKIAINLDEFLGFEDFSAGTDNSLSLPRTSTRQVETTVRVRPGDSILIAGLVREQDDYDRAGPGFNQPLIPTSRSTSTTNSELVFLLRPRVVVYRPADFKEKEVPNKSLPADLSTFVYDPATTPQTDLPMGTVSSDILDPAKNEIYKEPVIEDKDPRK